MSGVRHSYAPPCREKSKEQRADLDCNNLACMAIKGKHIEMYPSTWGTIP